MRIVFWKVSVRRVTIGASGRLNESERTGLPVKSVPISGSFFFVAFAALGRNLKLKGFRAGLFDFVRRVTGGADRPAPVAVFPDRAVRARFEILENIFVTLRAGVRRVFVRHG